MEFTEGLRKVFLAGVGAVASEGPRRMQKS